MNAFLAIGIPRSWWNREQLALYNRRRLALVSAMLRVGYTAASVRSHLGWITRRRKDFHEEVRAIKERNLGTGLLDVRDAAGEWFVEDRNELLGELVREQDEGFLDYLREVQEQFDIDYQEAENEWFAPYNFAPGSLE